MQFRGTLSFSTEKSNAIGEIGFIKKGIDALEPGDERSERVPIEFEPPEAYPPILITVAFKDSMGGDLDDAFTLDFNDRT